MEDGNDQLGGQDTVQGADQSTATGLPRRARYFVIFFQVGRNDVVDRPTAMQITDLLAERVTTAAEDTEIDMWLESPGGDAHSAYKIAAALLDYSAHLRVVIPDYAKSAATLMALAADELCMSRTAELGPLDAQIAHPTEKDRPISALDVAKCTADLAETTIGIVLRGGLQVLKITGLDRRETLSELLSFAAEFTSPMVSKLDPMTMHWAAGLLRVAEEYGKRLVARRGTGRQQTAAPVLKALVHDYPDHAFVIDRDEARRIGLPVRVAEEYEYWEYVYRLYRMTINSGESCIGLLSEDELDDVMASDNTGDDDDETST